MDTSSLLTKDPIPSTLTSRNSGVYARSNHLSETPPYAPRKITDHISEELSSPNLLSNNQTQSQILVVNTDLCPQQSLKTAGNTGLYQKLLLSFGFMVLFA
jgi:hypothetical protein